MRAPVTLAGAADEVALPAASNVSVCHRICGIESEAENSSEITAENTYLAGWRDLEHLGGARNNSDVAIAEGATTFRTFAP